MVEADFAGADLTEACLAGAKLDGANFNRATLTGVDFAGATYDAKTCWPEGFDIEATGVTINQA